MIVPWGFQPKGSCLPDLSSTAKRATAYATLGLFQIVAPPNGSSTELVLSKHGESAHLLN